MRTLELHTKKQLTLAYLGRLQKLSLSGFWAILDQGLFAFSNFIVSVFLARLLNPTAYGIFSTTLAIFYLQIVLHTSVLVEPMLVFAGNKYQGDAHPYQKVVLYLHWLFSLVSGALLLLAALVCYWLQWDQFVLPLIVLSLCGGLLLLPWLTRRLCYLSSNSRLAAITGLSHLLITLLGIAIIHYLHYASWVSAFVLLSITSLGSGYWILRHHQLPLFTKPEQTFVKQVARSHWQYGRWSLMTSFLIWIPYNLAYFIMPIWYTIEANATLKAVNNLIVPAQQTFAALSVYLLPIFSKQTTPTTRQRVVNQLALLFSGAALCYWLFLGLFKESLLWLTYGGNYQDQAQLLWVLGLVPVATSITAVYGSALRALEKPNQVFIAYLVATFIAVTLGIGGTYWWGLWGAVTTLVIAMGSAGAMLSFFYYRSYAAN